MRRAAAIVLACAALACEPDRSAELTKEIAELEKSRVARATLEKAKGETAQAEATLAEAQRALGESRAGITEQEAWVAALDASFAAELERNTRLRDRIAELEAEITAATQRRGEREEEVAAARERARAVHDQAAVLARELRPGDPAWARERRIEALRAFQMRLGNEYGHDTGIALVARETLPADPEEAARVGAGLAARASDRLAALYGLETESAREDRTPAIAAAPEERD